LNEAVKIFNNIKISERDIISWTTMIIAYGQNGKGKEALELFKEMQREGVKPNDQTVACVLKACCDSNLIDNAIEIFFLMERKLGIEPRDYHYNCMLNICVDREFLSLGKQIHKHMVEHNYPQNSILKNNLIKMYGKCGAIEEAVKIFNDMSDSERDIISWVSMISAYGHNEEGEKVIALFKEMLTKGIRVDAQVLACVLKACCDSDFIGDAVEILFSMEHRLGVQPNDYHYNCLLTACAENGYLFLGKKIHNHITSKSYPRSTILQTNLINMYSKCGSLEEAIKIFNNMNLAEKDTVVWTTMILAYGLYGKGKEALQLFEQMQIEDFQPNDQTIISVLSACSNSGLVQEAMDIFYSMDLKYKIQVDVDHCTYIVDVLGRVGRLEDAEKFITHYMKKHQIEPNITTWTTLLVACKAFMDVKRAERIAHIIMDLDPKDTSVYTLLSSIYTQTGNVKKREELRTLMDKRGINKIPNLSTVEVNDEVYQFISDDKSHPNIIQINKELQMLTEDIIKAGYKVETSWITRDIESEKDDIELICRHSEKLAIVWAVMNTTPGTATTITKNLRVCGDCHNAIKFMSQVLNRDIIVRDISKLHHFKDGKCSCGDYW
jgi:pentatricopeptide repeat protein